MKFVWSVQSMLMKLDEAVKPAPERTLSVATSRVTTPPSEPPEGASAASPRISAEDVASISLEGAVQAAVSATMEQQQGRASGDGDVSARTTADFDAGAGEAPPRLTADFADDVEGGGGGETVEVPVFSVSGVRVEVRPGTAGGADGDGAGDAAQVQGEPFQGSLRLETAQGKAYMQIYGHRFGQDCCGGDNTGLGLYADRSTEGLGGSLRLETAQGKVSLQIF
jgi:hypothetical protein